ncbi:ATP-dependent DNA ligase [Okibacterium fritillariae]|uniref:DNA ligase (ATP) n=1 Tax=Okibacterium fritillariae TaxID=123320 RepID=A0A1T5IWS2_9MICO|nr:ATP-dependent DNA ligase [Okibacterium fritillariae]SKC43610.1 ATP-dependent DNA ligase LigD ligase module /ATP-dependent DNA ligase LigD phosphoesterase module /ATP-dependent DNA ligase LigD polymerase module [Okibacterium fritillariae]
MAAASDKQIVTVDGHRLPVTNLGKVLYPETGTTKADVLDYYTRVAPLLLPHSAWRPATRKRWVHGVGTEDAPGQMFFQKDLGDGTPDWVKRFEIEHSDHTNTYPVVNDRATLAWLAQIAALEIHVPQWRFGPRGARKNPDRMVFDLDPGDGVGLPECVEAARLCREILDDMGMPAFPVTSGSKGIHLYASLDGKQTSDQVSQVAHELARALEADHPDLVVSDMKKALRVGKVLLDWSQNNGAKTTIAPYSLRGRARPTVAVPRTWEELESPELRHLEYDEVLDRIESTGDPMAAIDGDLVGEFGEGGAGYLGAGDESQRDRLHIYRSKRDAAITSEPVPAESPVDREGNSFVIQEHHASRLHWDFRLEHAGVLVSWALPKGVPTDTKGNHLAVQTEDHPLEYGSFEGSIPAGEYGAGEVTIWDAGTYELEKWRKDEVIARLTGRPDGGLGGTVKLALIRTSAGPGGEDGGDENSGTIPKSSWLIHRMKDTGAHAEHHADEGTADASRSKAGGASTKASASTAESSSSTSDDSDSDDSAPDAPASAPGTYKPMLATAGTRTDLRSSKEWSLEMKWDGIRAIVTVDDGAVTITSRNGHDITKRYPELLDAAEGVHATSAVLDGEIVALDGSGVPSFGLLQQRMNLDKAAEIERAATKNPATLMLFDVLEVNGVSIVDQPYRERRDLLERLIADDQRGRVRVPPAFDGQIDDAVETSRRLKLEGVVAKIVDSRYDPGRRSDDWVKLKHQKTQEVVVGGWRPGNGGRSGQIGSLLVGIPGEDGLTYVGRVGTGFSQADLAAIGKRLDALERKTSPFIEVPSDVMRDAHWVTPKVVGEVTFGDWTDSGHLRHPSWRGVRVDKTPEDVVREPNPDLDGDGDGDGDGD